MADTAAYLVDRVFPPVPARQWVLTLPYDLRYQRGVLQSGRVLLEFFFSSRRRHTRYIGDWSSDVCSSDLKKTSPQILWKGAFTQLSNSKVEANFADFRTYTYGNEPVDSAYHLGYDLSVTKR